MPLCALIASEVVPLLLVLRDYFRLKSAAHGAAFISFGSEPRFTVPTNHLLHLSWSMTSMWTQGPIRAIHVPAVFVDLLAAIIFSDTGHPQSIFEPTWVVLVFPIYALPAWWFVGRGFDGLLNRKRIRPGEMVLSAVLAIVFLGLAAGLTFGLSAAERDSRVEWYIYGFTFWGTLVSVPLFAWIRQRTRSAQIAHS